ncbi:MAG: translation initiation factor IF-2 [Thermoanaerobacteraceae bacterium]|nr:translation initiation factor IF-2 [Thermoanaerobacteraceae bacterium]
MGVKLLGKIRVYELSKELGIPSKDLISQLSELGVDVKNHMSTLEDAEVEMIRDLFNISKKEVKPEEDILSKNNKQENSNNKNRTKKISNGRMREPEKKLLKKIKIPSTVSIKDFSELSGIKVNDILKYLLSIGISSNINSRIDYETAAIIGQKHGIDVELEEIQDIESLYLTEKPDTEEEMEPRPPVITVMGHVDHGKTTLLDAIRKTNVTASEAGGITQHIGAYTVELNNKKIVFIDTPGHEAFTSMRARGAQITDIVVLVVAADDGVMPQTIEAINHAKAANVPIIVAVNKIDKPNANPDRVKQELTEYGLIPEEWGGDTIFVPISALKKQGINDLLEMILLLADLLDLKANPNKSASGIIIEARLDKGMGPVTTVLVQNGTLNVGDVIISGTSYGRVRALIDDKGRRVKKATPSIPVSVLGLSEVPNVGDKFYVVADEKIAKEISDYRKDKLRQEHYNYSNRISFDQLFNQIQEGKIKDFNIVLKGDVQGSVEAIKQSLLRLSNEEVRVNIIHDGVGAISETDVMLASASNAIVIGFNVVADAKARTLAVKEKVEMRTYRIIYELLDEIDSAMKGMLAPEIKEVILGRVEVRQVFKVPGAGIVAGSYVLDGKVTRNAHVRIIRNGTIINEDKISSLKRFKDDVREVAQGYECGIGLEHFNDIKVGDIFEIYTFEEIPR